MIRGENAILQAFLGTLVTWGLTAVGAGVVFFMVCKNCQTRKILDAALGFAGGVMVAASFWSLLSPAIDAATKSGYYGSTGQYAFGPVTIGFLLGAAFVFATDMCMPCLTKKNPELTLIETQASYKVRTENEESVEVHESSEKDESTADLTDKIKQWQNWKRMMLLIVSVTVHNIPEGLAIGVAFAAIGNAEAATFERARNLALGIGIQNFPEGMAVSVPLVAAGYSPLKSFFYGQLSGMVEPVFGILGAVIVQVAEPILPYALAFGAGAMIYVVFDSLIPDASINGNTRISSWGAMIGFSVMMCLEIGLIF